MRSWLAESEVPEAIFAVNDPAAIGAMQAWKKSGLRAGRGRRDGRSRATSITERCCACR